MIGDRMSQLKLGHTRFAVAFEQGKPRLCFEAFTRAWIDPAVASAEQAQYPGSAAVDLPQTNIENITVLGLLAGYTPA